MKTILMCSPEYYGIEYEINPWMDIRNQADKKKAVEQWENLYSTYKEMGVQIKTIDPVKGLPDMVFTANAGIVKEDKFVSGNYRFKERKGEEKYFKDWFKKEGFQVSQPDHFQGGEGDALFFKGKLYMGFGFRSDAEAHKEVAGILKVPYVSLKLIDPYFYDFDTAFCPINDSLVLYYPDAFDENSRKVLANNTDMVAMTREQAENFVGNSVYVNGTLLLGYTDDDLEQKVTSRGVKTKVLDMSEYKKAGGGIKCLTLYIEK